jgi:DNA-binding beta-propeller fold protein YncE
MRTRRSPLFALLVTVGSDPARAEIFVTSEWAIQVFDDDADGNEAPIRSITGLMYSETRLALGLTHRELFVASFGRIDVYSMSAGADAEPLRTIMGSNSLAPGYPGGIAIDHTTEEVYVTSTEESAVRVYSRSADGDVAPLRSIAGVDTGLDAPFGIFLDLVHGELLVANSAWKLPNVPSILVFDLTANGNVEPVRVITGTETLLENPKGLVVDLQNDEIVVTEFADGFGAVYAYSRSQSGNVPPLRRIYGPHTNLGPAEEIVLTRDDELLVVNEGLPSWFVGHERGAEFDADPTRFVFGDQTGLSVSAGIVSSRAKECSAGRAVDGCLFRDGFEAAGTCDWSEVAGMPACS